MTLTDKDGSTINPGSAVLPFTEITADVIPTGHSDVIVTMNFTGEGDEYSIPLTDQGGRYTFSMPAHAATLKITETAAAAAAKAAKK